jgi:hypothetical protein
MKSTKRRSLPNNRIRTTRKKRPQEIQGEIMEKKEGWIIVSIRGNPFERGFAHGTLLKREIRNNRKLLDFLVKNELEITMKKYMNIVVKKIKPIIEARWKEFYEEMNGIAKGAGVSFDVILALNSYITIYSYVLDGMKPSCSAFIATGNATQNGDIVMAHTTHTDFADGEQCNIILYVYPSNGNAFVMQTQPGFIASGTDWFLCENGIIGCETTIGDIKYNPQIKDPYYCRIRQCMQYGKTFDDYVEILETNNGGDYANSWLLGDVNTGEIMLFELGLHEKHIERKKNGFFYGMNSALGKKLREKETTDKDLDNIRTSSGNRNVRLQQLLGEMYKGKINVENAKIIIADHYDISMQKEERNSRGICKHDEFDDDACDESNAFYGSTDAKVVNTEMSKNLSFWGRFGSGCGRNLDVDKHLRKYPDNEENILWSKVVNDIPSYKWAKIDGTKN